MDEQYDLFGNPKKTIQERFEAFHAKNPRVYELLVFFAKACLKKNKTLGIGAIWERLRWEIYMETVGEEAFKLSNDFRSRYARLIMEQEPELEGFFDLRELRSD